MACDSLATGCCFPSFLPFCFCGEREVLEWSRSQREQDVGSWWLPPKLPLREQASQQGRLKEVLGAPAPPPTAPASHCPAPVLVPPPHCWGIVSSFFFIFVSTAGFLCGFHVSVLEWLGRSTQWLAGHSSQRGQAVNLCSTRSGGTTCPSLGGRRGQLKAESLGSLPGETTSPPSPEHCEESWRCRLSPPTLSLPPQPAFGQLPSRQSPAAAVSSSLWASVPMWVPSVFPTRRSASRGQGSLQSWLYSDLGPMPGDHLMGWVKAGHGPQKAGEAEPPCLGPAGPAWECVPGLA